MPPTMGGNTWPNDSGQSGTARPDPVLVTSPPAKIRTRVDAASRTAQRCRPRAGVDTTTDARPSVPARGPGRQRAILRQPVLAHLGRAVLVRAPVDGRELAREVAVRRRGGRHPLEGV